MRRNGTFPDMCACSTMFTRRERQKCADSLVCLLQALAGQSTRLELRNEISVTGTIVSVDSCMNTTVKDAVTEKLNGEKERFEELTVRGAQIRYVHIPESVDVMATVQKQVSALLPQAGNRRKQPSKSRQLRYAQERSVARQFKLGRGRGGGTTEERSEEVACEEGKSAVATPKNSTTQPKLTHEGT